MAQYVFTMNKVGKIVPPKRQILKDVSLSFFPGAKIGVLGTNGSGKSTLLKHGLQNGRGQIQFFKCHDVAPLGRFRSACWVPC